MTINIKELNIKKGAFEKVKSGDAWLFAGTSNLDGKIKVDIEEGIVTGSGEIDVYDISENMRNKLYDVLTEIENELNGVTIKTNAGGKLVSVHNGETVLTSDGAGNIYLKGNVEFSDAKLKQPEEDKEWKPLTSSYKEELKSHSTDKDEHVDTLNELGKIFNVVFNISQESDNKQIAKKIAERIKNANGKF